MSRRYDIIGSIAATGSTFATGSITVTATATKIPTTNLDNRKAIIVRNMDSSNRVYLGNSGVTASTGFPLIPLEALPFDLSEGAQLYGICDTGQTVEVRYLEVDNG